MEIKIKINTDNQAFEDSEELTRLLKEVTGKILDGTEYGPIHDINGNSVGSFKIK